MGFRRGLRCAVGEDHLDKPDHVVSGRPEPAFGSSHKPGRSHLLLAVKPARERFVELRIGELRVPHPEGQQDLVLYVFDVGAPAHARHQHAEQRVSQVAVVSEEPRGLGHGAGRDQRDEVHKGLVQPGGRTVVENPLEHVRSDAGVMGQHVPHRRLRRPWVPDPRHLLDVPAHRRVQVHQPLLHELHDRHGCKELGHRGQHHRCPGGERPPGSRRAEGRGPGAAIFVHERDGETLQVLPPHRSLYVPAELRGEGLRAGAGLPRLRAAPGQRDQRQRGQRQRERRNRARGREGLSRSRLAVLFPCVFHVFPPDAE